MANEKLAYELTVKTRAEGDGARKATQGMNDVTAATQKATAASHGWLTAAEAEVAEVERLVNAARRLKNEQEASARPMRTVNQFLDETADKARVASFAYYDLDAKISKSKNTIEELPDAVKPLGKASSDSGRAVLQLSQGLEDLQYGVRGVLNNIPGLVMSLGGTAGLAGAISMAAVGASVLYEWLSKTEEKAKFDIDFGAIANNYTNALVERLDEADRKRNNALRRLRSETAPDPEIGKAEARQAELREKSIEALIEATNVLNGLLGRQVAAAEAIAAAEEQKRQDRIADAQEAAKAQERGLEADAHSLQMMEEEADLKAQSLADAQKEFLVQKQQLKQLQEKIIELEKISELGTTTFGEAWSDPTGKAFPGKTEEAKNADTQLEYLKIHSESVSQALTAAYERMVEAERELENFRVDVDAASESFRRRSEGVADAIRNIEANSGIREVEDATAVAAQANVAIVEKIREGISLVTQSGEKLSEADKKDLEKLKEVISDGEVTREEMRQTGDAFFGLIGRFKGDVSRLLDVNEGLRDLFLGQQPRIDKLERQVTGLIERMGTAKGHQ